MEANHLLTRDCRFSFRVYLRKYKFIRNVNRFIQNADISKVSDWIVDFHTPGGVDRDGWQYATDFPSQYHGKKQFTDYVRRRRWFRRCQFTTSGPWQELGNTKLVDVSLYVSSLRGCVIFVPCRMNTQSLFVN